MSTTSRLRTWGEAHPEGGIELAARSTRYDRTPFWEFSVWVDWTRFGLGGDVEREYGTQFWPDRTHFAVMLGPLTFSAVRTWNEPRR